MPLAREVDVTGFDPTRDLARRAGPWDHRFPTVHLPDVVAFGVALADVEIGAWERDDPVVATRAYEARRFLLSDRILHWVVPLSFASGHALAAELRAGLLELGDVHRPAPILAGHEGLFPPGEDSYGPVDRPLRVSLAPPATWLELAGSHPGSARLWIDLAARASEEAV